jgi:hypothetical protein
MQPYFFPYLGYFSLIKNTDRFILFDTVQFIKQGWIERNRILRPSEGWQYISVPLVKHPRETKIKDVCISNGFDWREKVIRQLGHYQRKAPFFKQTMKIVESSIYYGTNTITQLDLHILQTVCEYLKIEGNLSILSELGLVFAQAQAPDEWPLSICNALGGVDEYWNPEGGLAFYDRRKYGNGNVDLHFVQMNLQPYSQGRPDFEPALSIIDAMMFNSPEQILLLLDDFSLL